MKKLKSILSIIIWPVVFMIGQFFIRYPFVANFNSKYLKDLKNVYPNLSDKELNNKLIDMINTVSYKEKLNNYIDSKALIIMLITFMIFGFIFYKIYSKYRKKGEKISAFKLILLGIFISLFYNIMIFNVNNVIHITDNYYLSNINLGVLIITTGIMGPILEELLFRGIVFNRLRKVTSLNKSILIASLIFSICHLPNIINSIYAFFLSFILIKVYLRYKTIKAPILIHCVCNIVTNLYLPILINNNLIINSIVLVISLLGLMFILIRNK